MNAEIICIGTELLLGRIVNTNASFIARKLAEIGIDHYFQATVGDNPQRLTATLRNAIGRCDITITTGGLGPTVDDITTRILAEITNRRLVVERSVLKDIRDYFHRQNRKIPKGSLRQTLIPEGSKAVKNPFGTAPGLIIEGGEKIIIALPGPPREMQPMLENYVIPYLRDRVKGQGLMAIIKSRSIKLFGLPEPKVNEKVKDLLMLSGPVRVGIYTKAREVELTIMTKQENERSADKEIAKIERIIRNRLKEYIYGVDNDTLESVVGSLLLKKGRSIAVAESCTGGLLSNLLTNVPGSSGYFKEGIIAYSNEAKIKYADVPAGDIKEYGAVSPQVAKAMAGGIRKRSNAGIGIGVTGIAGPAGATKTKPVGLVYIALSTKRGTICRRLNVPGTRTEIKTAAAKAALNLVRNFV